MCATVPSAEFEPLHLELFLPGRPLFLSVRTNCNSTLVFNLILRKTNRAEREIARGGEEGSPQA